MTLFKRSGFVSAIAIILAAAVGAVMAVSAFVVSGRDPFSIRVYGNGENLARVTAFNRDDGVPLPLREVCVSGKSGAPVCNAYKGVSSSTVRLPAGEPIVRLELKTDNGSRAVSYTVTPGSGPHPPMAIKPISMEIVSGSESRIGSGTSGNIDEYDNKNALAPLGVIPYPEQGRLRANLQNGVFLWARGCPEASVGIETAGGSGEIATDSLGMARFVFTPTLNETWLKTGCKGSINRVALRDTPGGVAIFSKKVFYTPGDTVDLEVESLYGNRDYTMDVFRDCLWVDSIPVHVAGGAAVVSYKLPSSEGLYSLEVYGNINSPGAERARAILLSHRNGWAKKVNDIAGEVKDPGVDPLVVALKTASLAEWKGPAALERMTAAFLSRLEISCGPPTLTMDTAGADASGRAATRHSVKSRGFAGIAVVWASLVIATFFHLAVSLKKHATAEERLEGQAASTIVLHLTAIGVLSVAFALIIYTLEIWFSGGG